MNRRPVDLGVVTKAVNEAWREYEMGHKPAFVIDLELPPGSFDVNVTPDKREAFIPNVCVTCVCECVCVCVFVCVPYLWSSWGGCG